MKNKLFGILLLSALSGRLLADPPSLDELISSAAQGNPEASYQLCARFSSVEGVEENHAPAAKWCLVSATQGNATAQGALGAMYHLGVGMERDYNKALGWYLKASEQGSALAQFNLAFLYIEGNGVQQDEITQHLVWTFLSSKLTHCRSTRYIDD